MSKRLSAVLVAAALFVTSAESARADEAAYEHVVGTFEGLGALGERYGASLEVVMSPRDAVTVYGWTVGGTSKGSHGLLPGFLTSDSATYAVDTRAQGIDLQYRRYVMPHGKESHGARGVFFAPGFEAASYVTKGNGCTTTYDPDNSSNETTCSAPMRQAFTYVAPSLDVGGQAILPFGLTLGASVGARYRFVAAGDLDESVMPFTWSASHGSGLRPRLRAWLGWAFL